VAFSGKTNAVFSVIISNSAFWPDIDLAEFQRDYRLPHEYLEPSVIEHTVLAISAINKQLAVQMAIWMGEGALTLNDVDQEEIGGERILIAHYKSAVMNRAKAEMLLHFATVLRKSEAENIAKGGHDTYLKLMAKSTFSVRYLIGSSRVSAELL
jgi:hypothetical protein